ncbi:hypothetical protein RUND412_003866 [Rhizina undulata]
MTQKIAVSYAEFQLAIARRSHYVPTPLRNNPHGKEIYLHQLQKTPQSSHSDFLHLHVGDDMHLLKSISSSVSGNPDEGVSVRSGMQFMIPISWTQEIASARNGLNVPIKEYQGPDDVFWHPEGEKAHKAALVVPKALESLNGPDSLVEKLRKTSSTNYHRKLQLACEELEPDSYLAGPYCETYCSSASGEYWDFHPSYCGSVRTRKHMKRAAMLYSSEISEPEYKSSITSPPDVLAASGKRSELAFENGGMDNTSESPKLQRNTPEDCRYTVGEVREGSEASESDNGTLCFRVSDVFMRPQYQTGELQGRKIQSESDDNGTVCFWIADCLLPASKPNNAASLDSDIFKMRERKAREYLAEHGIYEAESECSIISSDDNGSTPCFRIADCLLHSSKSNKPTSPDGNFTRKQAVKTREYQAEHGLHQQDSGSSMTSSDDGTVCFRIADCLPPPKKAFSPNSEIDKMQELKAQEYLAEKRLHEAESKCSTISSDDNGVSCFRIADGLLQPSKLNNPALKTRENLVEYGQHEQGSKSSKLSSDESGTAFFRIADALCPPLNYKTIAPKLNKDDIERAGGIRNFLANYGLNGPGGEGDMESESDGRTLCFRSADYVQDPVVEKRQDEIPVTWSRPSGDQLQDLTGLKIEFGERMLHFLHSLNPDHPDAPDNTTDFFYPPTRRCDPAKTPLPFAPEVLHRGASTLRRETDKIPRNYQLIPLYPEPEFSWEAGGRVWSHSTAWEYDVFPVYWMPDQGVWFDYRLTVGSRGEMWEGEDYIEFF